MKKLLLLMVFMFVGVLHSQTKKDKVREMLQLTGSAELGIKMMEQMIPTFQKAYPNVPNDFFSEFMKKINVADLQDLIIPIYESRFTEKEIDDFIYFYKSPSGKKLTTQLPDIFKESQIVGGIWGEKIAKQLIEEINETQNYSSPPPPSNSSPPPPMNSK